MKVRREEYVFSKFTEQSGLAFDIQCLLVRHDRSHPFDVEQKYIERDRLYHQRMPENIPWAANQDVKFQ